jgi:hypothetical protein
MRVLTQILPVLASLLLSSEVALATCPTCSNGAPHSQCGKWEPVPSCPYPMPSAGGENGACPGGYWPTGLHARVAKARRQPPAEPPFTLAKDRPCCFVRLRASRWIQRTRTICLPGGAVPVVGVAQ